VELGNICLGSFWGISVVDLALLLSTGHAHAVAKYQQFARDAQTSGDVKAAEVKRRPGSVFQTGSVSALGPRVVLLLPPTWRYT
jgi:hypothetical protein